MQEMAVSSFRMMVAFDFSLSNKWQNLHQVADPMKNGYMQVLGGLSCIAKRYVKDGAIPAYRFGCKDSEDYRCVPLCSPQKPGPEFASFEEMTAGYMQAAQTVLRHEALDRREDVRHVLHADFADDIINFFFIFCIKFFYT